MKNKMKSKTKIKIKMNFRFGFSFSIFVNSTWPRGATDGQLSLDWPRSAIAFLLNPPGIKVPKTINSLLLGLKCHSIFIYEFSKWPSGAIDGQLSLD